MKSEETSAIDPKLLKTALDRLGKALESGNVDESLQALHRVYELMAALQVQHDQELRPGRK